jgi:hypothetical protein
VPLGPTAYAVGPVHALSLLASPQADQPEYVRLSADLVGQVGELTRLAQAREGAERQDLTMLSRSTGWDPRLIALAANSERLASAANGLSLDAPMFYGLLRAGLPSDIGTLVHVDADTAAKALTLARVAARRRHRRGTRASPRAASATAPASPPHWSAAPSPPACGCSPTTATGSSSAAWQGARCWPSSARRSASCR